MSKIDRLRQRIAATGLPDDFDEVEDIDFNKSDRDNMNPDTPNLPWGKRQYERRDLIYKTRPKKLHTRKDRKLKDEKVVPGHEGVSYVKGHYKDLKKGTRKPSGLLTTEKNKYPFPAPQGKVEYSHNTPIMDRFYQELPKSTTYRSYDMSDAASQHQEEMAFVEGGRKIKPRKPTRMDWRSIITAKQLRQRIAQVRLAYAGPPIDVINAFRNKEALKFREKPKGRSKEYSFQSDGETLYQSGYPIAKHTRKGIKFSYQKHLSASTAQAGRMLGISTFTKKGKTYINGQEMNPDSYDYVDVPLKDIQKGTSKVNPNSKVRPMTPVQRQKIKDQDYFSTKARREWKDPETGEIYDQVVIQPEDQEEINRATGLDTTIPEETFASDMHHGITVEEYPELIRSTAGSTPLSVKSHQEAHGIGLIKRSLKKARLKIARMRQRNISRRVTQINMAKEDYDPVQAWASMIRNLKVKPAHQLEGNWTYLDGDLVDFDRPGSKETLMKSVKGNPKQSIFTVSNTHGIGYLFDDSGVVNPELQKRYDQLSSLKVGKTTIGKWEGKYDATVNFRDIDNKKAEEIARGAKGDIPQQAYIETFLNQETGEPESKFHSYNEKTDTYE